MNLEGLICRLRAVEPCDIDTMYAWENDMEVWGVSGTTSPYSRELLERFVEQQRFDIWQTRQMRLMIEPLPDCSGTQAEDSGSSPGTEHPEKITRHIGFTDRTGMTESIFMPPSESLRNEISRETNGAGETEQGRTLQGPADRKVGGTNVPRPAANPIMAEKRSVGNGFEEHSVPVGAIDLFEFDPQHRRAGIGILIHDPAQRGKGFAADALQIVCGYAHRVLGLHQLWCNVGADNQESLALFRRAGFTMSGIKREWQWSPDGFRDEIMMQKILSHRR